MYGPPTAAGSSIRCRPADGAGGDKGTHAHGSLRKALGLCTIAADNGGRLTQASGQIYVGKPERRAAFRAELPVVLRAWDVPESARVGVPKDRLVWRRAVLWPD